MDPATIPQLNPYGLQDGDVCDAIRIRHQPAADQPVQEVVISLPVAVAPTMEGSATEAYLQAKQAGHLTAGLMAVCQFFYLDDEADAWVEFDPAGA